MGSMAAVGKRFVALISGRVDKDAPSFPFPAALLGNLYAKDPVGGAGKDDNPAMLRRWLLLWLFGTLLPRTIPFRGVQAARVNANCQTARSPAVDSRANFGTELPILFHG